MMNSQVAISVILAVCLTGTAVGVPVSPAKSLSINAPVSGGYINPIGAYAGYYNQGYGGYGGYGGYSPYNYGFAPQAVVANNHQSSVSGVSAHGSAFNAYNSYSPFETHTGSQSYNPYFGSQSFDKFSSVPGATTKVSHKKNPFSSSFGASQTVGIPGLPGSYTVTTKTTATKHPVVYPTYGHFASFGGGYGGYGGGFIPYQTFGASPFAYGPPRQIRYQKGGAYRTLGKLTGYGKK